MYKNKRDKAGLVMCAAGGVIARMFLVSEKWMTVPDFCYVLEDGRMVSAHPFDIGFQWTTCLGMLGVILFTLGVIRFLHRSERCVAGTVATVVFLINICAWDFFDSISETYYGLMLGWDNSWMDICHILEIVSILAAVALLFNMLWRGSERANGVAYRTLAVMLVLAAGGSMLIKTFCNMWFFWQAVAAVGLTAIVCGGPTLKWYMGKRRKRREWRVITNV